MKINLTKKEYRALLEMLLLSDWMMHAHEVNGREDTEHKILKKKLLSLHVEMQANDIVEHSKELDDYYEDQKFSDMLHRKYIEPYDNNVLFEELIDRLSMRDLVNELGIEAATKLEFFERESKLDIYENVTPMSLNNTVWNMLKLVMKS